MSANQGCVSVDGNLLAPLEATVSALDAGLLVGDGLFESLRASSGHPYLLDRHIARLRAAAAELGYAGVPTSERLHEEVRRVLDGAALEDAYVRITLTRGCTTAPLTAAGGPATVIVAALPAPARRDVRGIAAVLIGPPAEQGPRFKSTSRQQALRAQAGVRLAGAEEGIQVSEHGCVLEGLSSNVFVVLGLTLLTPRLSECLPGVTRGRLLELASGAGVEWAEAPIERRYLFEANEVFVTNAVQGPRAVRSIDGRPVRRWRDDGGEVFASLLRLYESDRLAGTAVPVAEDERSFGAAVSGDSP